MMKSERGQTLVIMAMFMAALVMVLVLSYTVIQTHLERQSLTSALMSFVGMETGGGVGRVMVGQCLEPIYQFPGPMPSYCLPPIRGARWSYIPYVVGTPGGVYIILRPTQSGTTHTIVREWR